MSNIYWGVCEDRNDPLCLGRCKVRIIALHSEDKTILPTSDLPWAYPLLPTTSGSISGIGVSPTGILPGTWCAINFLDSAFQCPIIIGVVGGIPQGGDTYTSVDGNSTPQPLVYNGEDVPPNNIDGTSNFSANEGGAFVLPTVEGEAVDIGPLSAEDFIKLRETIAQHESGGAYNKRNTLGFIGRYQFGAAALSDLGYVKKGYTSKDLQNSECWTGKDDIYGISDFYANHAVQDNCIYLFTKANYNIIRRAKQLRNDSDRRHCAGLLMGAHLQGCGGAIKFAKGGQVNPDAYGTTIEKYYRLGYACIDGEMPKAMPTEDSALPLSEGITKSTIGFSDPDGVYPRRNKILEADTNRLARGEDIANTIVGAKEADRKLHVRIADSNDTWDQPHIPFAAQYPYNNVRTSEGGITEEFDNTPNAIRYQLYHPSGTYTEIDNNGTTVNRIVGDSYEILDRNGNITIRGNCNITVEGDANILSQNNVNLEVYGDCNAVVKNDFNTTVHGNMNTYVQGEYNMRASSINMESMEGNVNIISAAEYDLWAAQKINLTTLKGMTAVSDGGIQLKSKSSFDINSSDALKLQSTLFTSIKAAGNFSFDGAEVFMKDGKSVDAASPGITNIDPTKMRGSATLPATNPDILILDKDGKLARQEHVANDISDLPPIPNRFDGMSRLYDSPDDGDNTAFVKDLEDKMGETINRNVPTATAEAMEFNKDNIDAISDGDYTLFVNQSNIATGINISENYSIRQYLAATDGISKIVPQHGLSEGEIVQNLQYMSINIAEKVKELYPEMIISSGYRYAKTGSQHEKGQAMDMQFRGTNKSNYYNIAVELAKVLPFDQLILEYKDTGTGNPWIHVSFNKKGNRGEIYTYFNHSKVSTGLKKLA